MKPKFAIFLSFLMIVLFNSCSLKSAESVDNNSPQTRDVFAMDTYMSLKAYGDNADSALSFAEKRIYELENELSVTNTSSDIYAVNHADGKTIEICDDSAEIINKALEIGDKTDGSLDITLYPVVREWGFTTGEYTIPPTDKLTELLKHVDFKNIEINGNEITLSEKSEIDLGALAKGYTSDEIMKIMNENGVKSAIVSLGGNVQALGSKPDGTDWKISVRNPFSPDTDMCVLEISDKAVITSGNYERYFIGDDGNIYWHIIDSKDGFPADNGLVSVTIIGESGLECDAYSTAMFVAGTDSAIEFYRENNNFDMVLVTDNAKIYYTQGIADSFTNISEMTAEMIEVD